MAKRSLIPAVALLVLTAGSTAFAQVPRIITYQGVLADVNGTPVLDGNRTLTMSIYDAPTGGNLLYTETQNVQFVRGVFNVGIGSVTPFPASLTFDRPYYVGITVDNNQELSPRTELTSGAYAMRSSMADVANAISPNATGVVTNVNGQSGAVNLVGAGSTTVTQSGNTITVTGNGVSTVNGASGNVEIVGSGGTTITRDGSKITIGSNGSVKGVTPLDPSISVRDGMGPVAQVGVSELGITTPKIADQAVTSAKLAPGAVTVVHHSIAFQYFPADTQRRITAHLEALGTTATGDAPLAWLRFEFIVPDRAPELRLRLWPGGEDRLLATGHPHGAQVNWLG